MEYKSHVDMNKVNGIPAGERFEYRDVVQDDFPNEKHPEDGALFNREVEEGVYDNIVVSNEDNIRVRYKKV